MKQPEHWSRCADQILATGARPHFAPEPQTLEVHARVIERYRNLATLRALDIITLAA